MGIQQAPLVADEADLVLERDGTVRRVLPPPLPAIRATPPKRKPEPVAQVPEEVWD